MYSTTKAPLTRYAAALHLYTTCISVNVKTHTHIYTRMIYFWPKKRASIDEVCSRVHAECNAVAKRTPHPFQRDRDIFFSTRKLRELAIALASPISFVLVVFIFFALLCLCYIFHTSYKIPNHHFGKSSVLHELLKKNNRNYKVYSKNKNFLILLLLRLTRKIFLICVRITRAI